jgi:hypothetical protein
LGICPVGVLEVPGEVVLSGDGETGGGGGGNGAGSSALSVDEAGLS